jgi:hypothetical protein
LRYACHSCVMFRCGKQASTHLILSAHPFLNPFLILCWLLGARTQKAWGIRMRLLFKYVSKVLALVWFRLKACDVACLLACLRGGAGSATAAALAGCRCCPLSCADGRAMGPSRAAGARHEKQVRTSKRAGELQQQRRRVPAAAAAEVRHRGAP